jgi:hypothetical protein
MINFVTIASQELLQDIEKDTIEKKKSGRRMVIEEVEGEEEAETEISNVSSQGDNSKLESVNKESNESKENGTVNNSDDKVDEKPKRRMQIVEVDSESDDDEEEGEVLVNGNASGDDVNIPEVNNGPVKDEQIVNKDEDVIERNIQSEVKEEMVKATVEDKVSEETVEDIVNEVKKDDDTDDGRSSPVAAAEVKSDTDSADEDENTAQSSPSEEDKSVPIHDIKRPVFYMKELPQKIAVVKEEATTLFKSGQYGEACLKYNKLISSLENGKYFNFFIALCHG